MNKTLLYYVAFFSFLIAFVITGIVVSGSQSKAFSAPKHYSGDMQKDAYEADKDCPWVKEHTDKYQNGKEKTEFRPVNLDTKAPLKII